MGLQETPLRYTGHADTVSTRAPPAVANGMAVICEQRQPGGEPVFHYRLWILAAMFLCAARRLINMDEVGISRAILS